MFADQAGEQGNIEHNSLRQEQGDHGRPQRLIRSRDAMSATFHLQNIYSRTEHSSLQTHIVPQKCIGFQLQSVVLTGIICAGGIIPLCVRPHSPQDTLELPAEFHFRATQLHQLHVSALSFENPTARLLLISPRADCSTTR